MPFRTILFVVLLTAQSCLCMADTLYLKNGQAIKSENIWREEGHYMYTIFGATVGIPEDEVERVSYGSLSGGNGKTFQFDVWPFGSTVQQSIEIAKENNLPLHKEGNPSENNGFDPVVQEHADANVFYYNTNLLGFPARVKLFFTPKSRQLYNVKINWPNQNPKDTMLVGEIVAMLSEKYGDPSKTDNEQQDATLWTTDDAHLIQMDFNTSSVDLSYLHTGLNQVNQEENETLEIRRIKAGTNRDKAKF